MSYCAPRWISPYTYLGLLNAIKSRWAAANRMTELGDAADQEILHLKLSIRGDTVQVLPSFHRPGGLVRKTGQAVPVRIDLLAEDGTLLVSQACRLADATQDPHGPVLDLQEDLPWYPETASIAIVRDRRVIHTIDIEREAPSITVDDPKVEKRTAHLSWHAEHPEHEPVYVVDYSNDVEPRGAPLPLRRARPRLRWTFAAYPVATAAFSGFSPLPGSAPRQPRHRHSRYHASAARR